MSFLRDVEVAIPALRRYAMALVHDPDRADDLVQDCLERALARRHLWRGDGPVRAWMFTILLNRLRDDERKAPPRGHLVPIDALPDTGAAGAQEHHMALAEVARALERLPADQRRALLLVTVGGQTLGDAARILEIPEGTLVSRLGRARDSLRSLVGRDRPRKDARKDNGQT